MTSKMENLSKTRGLRIGLTGGMGCGKSAAAGFFVELGFAVLESDKIVRELWESDAEMKKAAVARWGGGVLKKCRMQNAECKVHEEPNGESGVDRRKIAEIVFADPVELRWLEELLHPRVEARWREALAAAPERDWVVEIPLLFEKSLASEFDFTLCVWASPPQQAVRLAPRGLSPAEITARQARQLPLLEKVARADWVVLNDGNLEFLRRQTVWIAGRLRKNFK